MRRCSGTGPHPKLPPPHTTLIPTADIAPTKGWRDGVTAVSSHFQPRISPEEVQREAASHAADDPVRATSEHPERAAEQESGPADQQYGGE